MLFFMDSLKKYVRGHAKALAFLGLVLLAVSMATYLRNKNDLKKWNVYFDGRTFAEDSSMPETLYLVVSKKDGGLDFTEKIHKSEGYSVKKLLPPGEYQIVACTFHRDVEYDDGSMDVEYQFLTDSPDFIAEEGMNTKVGFDLIPPEGFTASEKELEPVGKGSGFSFKGAIFSFLKNNAFLLILALIGLIGHLGYSAVRIVRERQGHGGAK